MSGRKKQRLITIQLHTGMEEIEDEWLRKELDNEWVIASIHTTGGCQPTRHSDSADASAWVVVLLEREER